MKRVLLMLAATAAFACTTAFAQVAGSAGNASGSSTAANGSVAAGAQEGSQTQADTTTGHHHKKGAMSENGTSGKMSTLTGCVSSSADSSGNYTLSNGRYKNGVEIGPSDKVKDHAGHQVALKGHWSNAAAAGENGGVASSTSEKGAKHFEVDSVKHISDTCKEAPGGGTMGHKSSKKSKKGDTGTTTPPQI